MDMLLSVVAADNSESRRLGLHNLVAANVVDALGERNVATRTIAASRRAVCLGGQRDPEQDDKEGEGEEDEEEGGCWVKYGWRRRLRRLPPLIPSLRRAGSSPWTLTRTHTSDGRVVVTRDPAPQRGRVVARKMDGRLILDLVDSSPVPADMAIAPGLDVPAVVLEAPIVSPVGSTAASPVPAVAFFEAVINKSPLQCA